MSLTIYPNFSPSNFVLWIYTFFQIIFLKYLGESIMAWQKNTSQYRIKQVFNLITSNHTHEVWCK